MLLPSAFPPAIANIIKDCLYGISLNECMCCFPPTGESEINPDELLIIHRLFYSLVCSDPLFFLNISSHEQEIAYSLINYQYIPVLEFLENTFKVISEHLYLAENISVHIVIWKSSTLSNELTTLFVNYCNTKTFQPNNFILDLECNLDDLFNEKKRKWKLTDLDKIKKLALVADGVSHKNINNINSLPNLTCLNLGTDCVVDDQALAKLKLENLEELILEGNRITDSGIMALPGQLPKLKTLKLRDASAVTKKAIAFLNTHGISTVIRITPESELDSELDSEDDEFETL